MYLKKLCLIFSNSWKHEFSTYNLENAIKFTVERSEMRQNISRDTSAERNGFKMSLHKKGRGKK